MSAKSHVYLKFAVSTLKLVNLWPKVEKENKQWRMFKDFSLILSIMPCIIPIMGDFVLNLCDDNFDVNAVAVNLIAMGPIYALIYITLCFVYNRQKIMALVDKICDLNEFSTPPDIFEADKSINLYTKLFIVYGILGNIVYAIMPFINIDHCTKNRPQKWIDRGVPCGLITRAYWPVKFDYTPMFEFVFFTQFYVCIMLTVVIMAVTMLMCGMMMMTVSHLKHLRNFILSLSEEPQEKLVFKVHFCVQYHIAIIEYSQKTNQAFGIMMLLHVTLTSFVISVLGFEMVMVETMTESLRFAWHLGGWLVLLFLICYYGQVLIDESMNVATDTYATSWLDIPVALQKDLKMVIMRAQKPLSLSAANLGIMSFPAFLKVLSSAYSYFTLLVKLKN